MKLIKISIHGFKSFADKVSIDIKDGITGIVGPNGSGKSNIVDAVKWVLGEQSLKDIRGGSVSSDVIFCGSKTRKPLTRGWVSLTFDNSDHYLHSDLTEIEIKRVVYSTGENEYYLNNESVRLKDITDLFIDSGSSVNSLSIISQGKIGEIIDGKPEDKRAIIEEAAGVLKYKKRKEDALRKLDKTNDNLERINLIINELSTTIDPLAKEAEVAKKYLTYQKELENTDIALLGYDINNLNLTYKKHLNDKDNLNNQIMTSDNLSLIDSSKTDTLKLNLMKLEESIAKDSDELYMINNELSSLASEKQIMMEREKYKVDDTKLQNNILSLREDELKLKNNLKTFKEEIKLKENDLTGKEEEQKKLNNEIEIINNNMLNDNKLPYSVKAILNNKRLNGIKDAVGKVIETESNYSTALDIALGYTANVIITDNENSAKDAINYLKQNGLGRATFYPLNVIKPKGIDQNTLNKIKDDASFIGVASDLVKYDPIYRNIILNTLGNTIIVDNLTSANKISSVINHSYKIVTLDGELIAAGGAITGGSIKGSGLLNQKYELENKIKLLDQKSNQVKLKEEEINQNDHDLTILESKIFNKNNECNSLKELLLRKYADVASLEKSLTSVQNEIEGTSSLINNPSDKAVDKILNSYYEVNAKKEALELKLNEEKGKKNDLQSEINELELATKKNNSDYNKKLNELKEIEIAISKEEIKLDNLLARLSDEYSLTFEKAYDNYKLEDDNLDEERLKVNNLRRDIKALGNVNTGSIAEYERLNTRYTFLSKQKEDLTSSINDLLTIINELDKTMKDKLKTTYEELNTEFNKVFHKLFRGGEASLILTNPDDILNTGVEIKATPPGKDIKNTKTLSGGESTLTAISLLFAILNIRTVPFCILDEVEAALDDANVDMFGSYLKELNSHTQFIIITHKKRTMEYTDNLYGITMQESGVSKLVSVKLSD